MLIPVLECVSSDHIVVVLPAEFQFCVNERNSRVVCSGLESFLKLISFCEFGFE